MDKEWMKTVLPIVVAIVVGVWTLYSNFDERFDRVYDKFDQIDTRLNSIEKELAEVKGWIRGKYENTSDTIISSDTVSVESTIITDSLTNVNDEVQGADLVYRR